MLPASPMMSQVLPLPLSHSALASLPHPTPRSISFSSLSVSSIQGVEAAAEAGRWTEMSSPYQSAA